MYFLPPPPPFDICEFGFKEHVGYGNSSFFQIASRALVELIKVFLFNLFNF